LLNFVAAWERGVRDQSLSPRGDASIRVNLANAIGSKAPTLDSAQAAEWYQAAVTEFRKAIEEDPVSGGAHRNLAIVLAQRGRREEAIAELKVTLRLAPNEPIARQTLAELEQRR
jgi:tetratricopeptide (TPR) repeat protein